MSRQYERAIEVEDNLESVHIVPMGHSMCIAGYLDCPDMNPNHFHCGNCGRISGHQGHYSKLPGQTDWQFNCPEEEEAA